MKKNTLPALLASGCTLAGLLCKAARHWLLNTGIDERGLLTTGHPGVWISWILTGAVVIFLLAAVLRSKPKCCFYHRFPIAVGSIIQAITLTYLAISLLQIKDRFHLIAAIVAIACVFICLAELVLCWQGKAFPTILRCPLILFYLLFLVVCYQLWTREPQLQFYCFQLLALICLTLASYHRCALELGHGSSRIYLLSAYAGVYFCITALPGSNFPFFFVGMAIATLMDECHVPADKEA